MKKHIKSFEILFKNLEPNSLNHLNIKIHPYLQICNNFHLRKIRKTFLKIMINLEIIKKYLNIYRSTTGVIALEKIWMFSSML